MLTIRLFGTPHLQGASGVLSNPGPRRVAMLASLAASGSAGITRDKLVARLWPDADDDRARRNLSQLLYSLRTELGVDLVEGTSTLRLDPAQCSSDVGAFDQALAERRDADAVALYTGPFLDGFHLSESPEFSQWADAERDRREAAARQAAVRLAEAASKDVPHEASMAWSRAVALDPHNTKLVLRLMDAYVRSGDRTSALRTADQYATRVRAELEAEPDAGVMQRVEAIRKMPPEPRRDSGGGIARVSGPVATVASAPRASVTDADAGGSPRSAGVTRGDSSRRRAFVLGGVAVAALIAIVAWTTRDSARLANDEFVIIAEFENRTGDSLLTHTVGAAVSSALQQSANVVPLPRVRVANVLRRMERPDTLQRLGAELAREVAVRDGVRLVLDGEILQVGDKRQLISRIVEAQSGRVLRSRSFTVESDADLLPAIDRLAARMRRDLGDAATEVQAARPLPEVTTASLPALAAYSQATDADYRADGRVSIELLLRAIEFDSNFASAHAQLGSWYNRNNNIPKASYHFTRALALSKTLPLHESLRIRIAATYARGNIGEAVMLSREMAELRPRDVNSWTRLGFYLSSNGQQVEALEAFSRAAALAPLDAQDLVNIGNIWANGGRGRSDVTSFDSARVHYERAFAISPEMIVSVYYNQQYGAFLIGAGKPDSAEKVFDIMMAREPNDRARGLRSNAYLDALRGRWARAAERFSDAAEISIRGQQNTSAIRNDALTAEARLLLGDRAAALAAIRRATATVVKEPLETRAVAFVAHAALKAGDSGAVERLLQRMRAMARPEFAAEQAAIKAIEGGLLLNRGRSGDAVTKLREALRLDSIPLQTRVLYARALSAAGQDSLAERAWGDMERRMEFGLEGQFDWQFADYERGKALERLGLSERAAELYRRQLSKFSPAADVTDPAAIRDLRERLGRLETPK
ncbi:MAG: BTAD domain-containing putative transcriptional regulator [Gemmatimonadaceae bacterium]